MLSYPCRMKLGRHGNVTGKVNDVFRMLSLLVRFLVGSFKS